MSAHLYPNTLLFLGCLAAALLIFHQIRKRQGYGHSKVKYAVALRVSSYVLGMVLYMLGMEYLGFMISSVLAILGLCLLLGERNPWLVGPLSLLAPLAIYFLFTYGLGVQLPPIPWMD